MALRSDLLPENSRIVQPAFLEKASNKKDLIRRLRGLVQVFATDEDIEEDSPEWPGLDATANVLVERYLQHKDKEVRLYTVQACMELFSIYAPESPWDPAEILRIFRQTIRQLANLAHTTSPDQAHYASYLRILTLLAEVRIGAVLVELANNYSDDDEDNVYGDSEKPMDVLADLIRTLLTVPRHEHANQVLTLAQAAVVACLDEYSHSLPVPILDEVLLVLGQGPTILVTNPAAVQAQAKKKSSKKMPPLQVEQPNASYLTAAAVIRTTLNKTATPIAALLNGLLNGEAHLLEQSQITADFGEDDSACTVWTIVYQLARVAPEILVTVIGTVSNGLRSDSEGMRYQVTKLLGKLFCSGNLALKFHACFREWLARQHDIDPKVRRVLVRSLVRLLGANHTNGTGTKNDTVVDSDVLQQADAALVNLMTDPSLEIRMEAIEQVTELAYRKNCVSPRLLRALGDRVSSKTKQERKAALTGLAQVYHRHFCQEKLKNVLAGGDDCDLAVILNALHDTCHLDRRRRHQRRQRDDDMDFDQGDALDVDEEKYAWIPRKVFECVCFTDQVDTDMHSRVILIVDEILLGSDSSSSASSSKSRITPTARAVGLAMILDSLREGGENLLTEEGSSNASKFLQQLMIRKAHLQHAVSEYIDARAKIRECEPGSEEALAADSKAMSILETVAKLSAPVSGSQSTAEILKTFHGAKDKHIFRILATITSPSHSMSARARALDELPKRTKSLGDSVSGWVKALVRRCAMGNFLNVEVINHCVLLAQESFFENDVPACGAFLTCAKFASRIFPALCGTKKTFETLTELFSQCRTESSTEKKKEIEESGIITTLSSTLSAAAPTARAVVSKKKEQQTDVVDDDLQAQLLQLCTRDGTPEQARHAVYTLARLLSPNDPENISSPVASRPNDKKSFSPLLKSLTSPTRLSITSSSGKESTKLVSVLTALSAFADCAPDIFGPSERGDRAIKFALETILMGRSDTESDDEDASMGDEPEEADTPTPSRKKRHGSAAKNRRNLKHLSPEAGGSLLEDETLSIACRRVCAAIDFLVSYARSAVLQSKRDSSKGQKAISQPSPEQLEQIFQLITQILCDKGLPPSNRDRRLCKSRQDRAALRQCAAVHLLRLCDPRLGFEKTYLSNSMWHVLGEVFLDEERVVREAAMEELSAMLLGTGVYGHEVSRLPNAAPALRFLAFTCLCTDGDHGADHDVANGNAANVGKLTSSTKKAALTCIGNLRKACEDCHMHCRVRGKESERMFESRFKMLLMPEYAVPFAFHLLALRRETPSSGGTPVGAGAVDTENSDEEVGDIVLDDESQQRVLRKRLKWLLEPLVQSLGDGADNIGFLLRMTEILGKQYRPVDVQRSLDKSSSSSLRLSIGSEASVGSQPVVEEIDGRGEMLEAKLKTICVAAREVLLSFVKKDVNLSPYPGKINIPQLLFKASGGSALRLSQQSNESSQSLLAFGGGASLSPKDKPHSPASNDKSHSPASIDKSLSPASPLRRSRRSSRKSKDSVEAATDPTDSERKSTRVHFSPELEVPTSLRRQSVLSVGKSEKGNGLDDLSPIAKSTPTPRKQSTPRATRSATSASSAATLGSEPPSILRNATIRSTAPEGTNESPESRAESNTSSPAVPSKARRSPESNEDDLAFTADDEVDSKADSETSSPFVQLEGRRSQESKDHSLSFTAEESVTSGADSKTSSPVVQSEARRSPGSNDGDDEGDGINKVTSETQSTLDTTGQASKSSRTSGRRKRKPSILGTSESAPESKKKQKQKRGTPIPVKIQIHRSSAIAKPSGSSADKKGKKKRRGSPVDEYDFDFAEDAAPENQPVGRNRPKKSSKKTAAKKGRAASVAAKTEAPKRSRPLRTRGT